MVGEKLHGQPIGAATAAYCHCERRPLLVSVCESEGEEEEAGGGCHVPWTAAWGQQLAAHKGKGRREGRRKR